MFLIHSTGTLIVVQLCFTFTLSIVHYIGGLGSASSVLVEAWDEVWEHQLLGMREARLHPDLTVVIVNPSPSHIPLIVPIPSKTPRREAFDSIPAERLFCRGKLFRSSMFEKLPEVDQDGSRWTDSEVQDAIKKSHTIRQHIADWIVDLAIWK